MSRLPVSSANVSSAPGKDAGFSLPALVHDCFLADVNALKPGNVGRHGGGHGMDCEDFVRSAAAATPPLCDRRLDIGRKILRSVEATRAATGCNTNLGLVLLFAPIIRVFERHGSVAGFRPRVTAILKSLARREAQDVFAAIRLAAPGGLGKAGKYDVHSAPDIDVCTAMVAARARDLVARQYADGYREVADLGVKCLRTYHHRWQSVEWAVVSCYLMYLGSFPDSHVARKYGNRIAQEVRDKAIPLFAQFIRCDDPEDARAVLLSFDRELKESKLNPGACADLTVASLLLYRLGDVPAVTPVAGAPEGTDRPLRR